MSERNTVVPAIAAVAAAVPAIPKSVKKGGVNFAYRGIDDIMNALHPLMTKEGLVIVPRAREARTEPHVTSGGAKWIRVTLDVEFDVYGPGGDKLDPPMRVMADALDNADKAYGKAFSYAIKTAYGILFHIPTEGDNEATEIPAASEERDYTNEAKRQILRVAQDQQVAKQAWERLGITGPVGKNEVDYLVARAEALVRAYDSAKVVPFDEGEQVAETVSAVGLGPTTTSDE